MSIVWEMSDYVILTKNNNKYNLFGVPSDHSNWHNTQNMTFFSTTYSKIQPSKQIQAQIQQ